MSDESLSFEFDEDIDEEENEFEDEEELENGEDDSDEFETGSEEEDEFEDDDASSSDIFGSEESGEEETEESGTEEDEFETGTEEDEDEDEITEVSRPTTTQNIAPAPTPIPTPSKPTKITLNVVKPAVSENVGTTLGRPVTVTKPKTEPTPSQIEEAVKPVKKKRTRKTTRVKSEVGSLDDILVKRYEETPEFFAMRSAYAKAAKQIFGTQINFETAALLGEMASNRALYGITYPEKSNVVLDFLSDTIIKS